MNVGIRVKFRANGAHELRYTPSFAEIGETAGDGQVAQLVEQRIENPRVGGSIPPLATKNSKGYVQT